jgi:hypothetical protein
MFCSNCGSELPETGNCPSCGKPRPSLGVQSPSPPGRTPGIASGCLGAGVGWLVAAPLGAFIGYMIGYAGHPYYDTGFKTMEAIASALLFGVIGSFVGPIVGSVVAIHLTARKAAESKDTEPKQEAAGVEKEERL